jgi:hypothetical protein
MKLKKKKSKIPKQKKNKIEKEEVVPERKMPIYLSYWMSHLPEHVQLRDLIIPGTHAANSHDLKEPKLLKAFAKCQKLKILDQLEMGIRYLDLRYGIKNKKALKKLGIDRYFLYFYKKRSNFRERKEEVMQQICNFHGVVSGGPLVSVLEDIKEFIVRNKREFLILRFQQEGSFFPDFCKLVFVEKIMRLFGNQMINQEDRKKFFRIKDVTMGQLWSYNKKCLILCKKEFFEDYLVEIEGNLTPNAAIAEQELKEKGIYEKEKFILDCWFNRDKAAKLINDMDESFHTINRRGLRVSHYVFSPQKKFKINYLLKPPTIKFLEKTQFLKDNIMMSHIVENIYNGRDINVSKLPAI